MKQACRGGQAFCTYCRDPRTSNNSELKVEFSIATKRTRSTVPIYRKEKAPCRKAWGFEQNQNLEALRDFYGERTARCHLTVDRGRETVVARGQRRLRIPEIDHAYADRCVLQPTDGARAEAVAHREVIRNRVLHDVTINVSASDAGFSDPARRMTRRIIGY